MSDGKVHDVDGIQINNDGAHRQLALVNVGSVPSIPQARGSGSDGGTAQNKYVNFFSYMDEKSDIDIGLNEVAVPKNTFLWV